MKRLLCILFFILSLGTNALASDTVSYYTKYPFRPIQLSQYDNNEIMLLLKASADIMNYDCNNYNIHELTKSVLYTKDNFKVLGLSPAEEGRNDTLLKFCSSDFIDSVLYKVFRLDSEKPSADKLLEYSYYYSNGYYYYAGGFNTYFATDVIDISEVYEIDRDIYYIIFRNTYVEGARHNQFEFSSSVIAHDIDGYYLKRLNMNSEPLSYDELNAYVHKGIADVLPDFGKYLPYIIIIAGIAVITAVIYKYIFSR